MHRFIVSAIAAAALAGAGTTAIASAHGWHHHHGMAYVNASNALIVGNDGDSDDVVNNDVVGVAEPASQYVVAAPAAVQYVPVNDTVVTPYGYTPTYANGYYQGYSYAPQYGFNPYYAGAAYSANPIADAVVSTIANTVSNGGHVDTNTLVSSLLLGFLASQYQSQQPYYPQGYYPAGYVQPAYAQPVYAQPVYAQPVYQQVYVQPARVYVQQQPTLVEQLVPVLLQRLIQQ